MHISGKARGKKVRPYGVSSDDCDVLYYIRAIGNRIFCFRYCNAHPSRVRAYKLVSARSLLKQFLS